MKLNLGCGGKLLEGFVNVDLPGNWSSKKPDIEADISKPLPFDDESADEVHSYHVIEHLYRWQVEEILADWVRVLKPGGLMVVECPCLDKILKHFAAFIEAKVPVEPRLTILGLYGDPAYRSVEMTHKWAYSISELCAILRGLGLDPKVMPATTHQPVRDMRIEARKPLRNQ